MARLIQYLRHSLEPVASTLLFRVDRVRPDGQMGIFSRAWSLRYVFVAVIFSLFRAEVSDLMD